MNKSSASDFPVSANLIRLNLKFLWAFAFLSLLFLLIVSVFQLNNYTAKIYLIDNYQKKINQFAQENKILEINITKANSLWNAGSYVQNFERADKIKYIRVFESTALAR